MRAKTVLLSGLAMLLGGCITNQAADFAAPFDGVWKLTSASADLGPATVVVRGGVIRKWIDDVSATPTELFDSRTTVVQAGRIVWSYDLYEGEPRFISLDVALQSDGTLAGTMTHATLDPFAARSYAITLEPF